MSTIEKIAGRDMTRGSGILDQSGQAAWLVIDIRDDRIVASYPVSQYRNAVDAMVAHGKLVGSLCALGADYGDAHPVIVTQTY